MKLALNTLFLLLLSFGLNAQTTVISGIILSKVDSIPVQYAHIVNYSNQRGVVSDNQGSYTITANLGDSIIISAIGFETVHLKAANGVNQIYLKKAIHELETYTVLPYKTYTEFKEAFVELKLEDDGPKINNSIYLSIDELKSYEPKGNGLVARGAIEAFAALFNKRIQDKKNYDRLIARDNYEALLATKFNPHLVKHVTKIKDEFLVNDFMEYCDFTDQFIEYASEYVLITQIFECFYEYESLPVASK